MKLRIIISVFCMLFAVSAFAQTAQPEKPNANPKMDANLKKIEGMKAVKNMVAEYGTEEAAKNRFKEHMEMVRISSPSRYELYRGMELAKRFKEAGFKDDEIVFDVNGVLPGASIQLIDGLPVWNACAIVKGTTPADPKNGIYSRPKVLIEGHIDTVNPSSIDISDKTKIPASAYDTIRIAPVSQPVVSTPAELKAISETLNFDANNKIIEDENFKKAYKRFANADEAAAGGAYRIYIPGIGDAMSNTNPVYQMAKMFKKYDIKPVYDIWFCGTSGEEGRGNLAGMKQLYGYNQQADEKDNAMKGKNSLNFVANLSVDGGGNTVMVIHYLGSNRFEVNYKSTDGKANAAVAAAKAVNAIANVKTPNELDPSKARATYTVGTVYAVDGDGSQSTSFEVDMRSVVPDVLNETRASIEPKFALGEGEGIEYEVKWFGDRPAHQRSFDAMANDPFIYAAWKAYEMAAGKQLTLPQYPKSSSSLNDNIPAAIGVPSINIALSKFAVNDGGHSFNEWGVPATIDGEVVNFKQVLLTLLATAGVHDEKGNVIVQPVYGKKGARHVDVKTDSWEK